MASVAPIFSVGKLPTSAEKAKRAREREEEEAKRRKERKKTAVESFYTTLSSDGKIHAYETNDEYRGFVSEFLDGILHGPPTPMISPLRNYDTLRTYFTPETVSYLIIMHGVNTGYRHTMPLLSDVGVPQGVVCKVMIGDRFQVGHLLAIDTLLQKAYEKMALEYENTIQTLLQGTSLSMNPLVAQSTLRFPGEYYTSKLLSVDHPRLGVYKVETQADGSRRIIKDPVINEMLAGYFTTHSSIYEHILLESLVSMNPGKTLVVLNASCNPQVKGQIAPFRLLRSIRNTPPGVENVPEGNTRKRRLGYSGAVLAFADHAVEAPRKKERDIGALGVEEIEQMVPLIAKTLNARLDLIFACFTELLLDQTVANDVKYKENLASKISVVRNALTNGISMETILNALGVYYKKVIPYRNFNSLLIAYCNYLKDNNNNNNNNNNDNNNDDIDAEVKKVYSELVDLYYENITDMEQKGVLEKENRALDLIENGQCNFLKNYLEPASKRRRTIMGGRRRYRTKIGTRKRK